MDETPPWFDIPATTTMDFAGVKTVTSKTTGAEKLRFTAALTVTSTGQRLPMYIIFRGLKNPPPPPPPKGPFPKDIVVGASKWGVMTSQFMTDTYIPQVWRKRPGALFNAKSVLVLDAARAHMTGDVKEAFSKTNTDIHLVPGGMTPISNP